jgi:hypothetical protein
MPRSKTSTRSKPEAFLAGQLFLKVQLNPALLRLTDPYDPWQFAPTI